MGDHNIDKTLLSSDTCSIYPDPNAAAAVCALSEPVVDLTDYSATSSASSSNDTFSQPVRLPSHLSLHDRIRFSDDKGGSRTLEVVDLIRESRKDSNALQQLRLLTDLAAKQDPEILNACYVDREENLLPALAQLASSDPVTRHEGALTLRSFILGHPEDRVLQQGLLATVSNIAQTDHNSEARQIVVSVYQDSQDSSSKNAGLKNWIQSHTPAPSYVGEWLAQADKVPTNAAASSLVEGSAQVLDSRGCSLAEAAIPLAIATVFPTLPPVPLGNSVTEQILSFIKELTSGSPLQGIPPEGILAFAQNNAQLPAAQFESGMRLRILASALPLNDFNGASFGHSGQVATQLAGKICDTVNSTFVSKVCVPLAASPRSSIPLPTGEGVDGIPRVSTHAIALNTDPIATQSRDDGLVTGFSTADNFFVPPLLTSLSGMQSLAYQYSALGPSPLTTQAMGLSYPPSYHIEGPTTLDEDGHQGFGGHSQGQGSGQQDGRSHDQQPGQPDAYLA